MQSGLDILCSSTYTTLSIHSESVKRRPRSACANAKVDKGLHCPQVARGSFSCVAHHFIRNVCRENVYANNSEYFDFSHKFTFSSDSWSARIYIQSVYNCIYEYAKSPLFPVIAVTVLNIKTKMRRYLFDTFLTEVELCRNTLII